MRPEVGRFNSPDPSGQEKNPYLYAEGDPVNRIDPDGIFPLASWVDDAMKKVGKAGNVVSRSRER